MQSYQSANRVECVMDSIEHEDTIVTVCTRQNGLVHAFKTVVSCEEDHGCKYHYFIFDTESLQASIDLHASMKLKIESGEDLV
jgi:hypothetical protein